MRSVNVFELEENVFDLWHHQWALVTAEKGASANPMTASWGGFGILWNMPVVTAYVRPQRFTKELLDKNGRFSLCFLSREFLSQKQLCGKVSGRDTDKMNSCGFDAVQLDGVPVLTQSRLALTCESLFVQQLAPECFLDASLIEKNYPQKDFHYMYIAKILGAYYND